jgi:hypothetical protein
MGAFEEHPWLLILIVIATVEAWNAFKALAVALRDRISQRNGSRSDGRI